MDIEAKIKECMECVAANGTCTPWYEAPMDKFTRLSNELNPRHPNNRFIMMQDYSMDEGWYLASISF